MVQWYVFALISALFSALAAITQKKVLFKEKALVFCAVLGFFNLIIAIPFFFFIDFSILSYSGLIVLFIKSFLAAFSFLFVMLGIKNLELSRALPLLVLTPGLVAITAYIFLQEALSKMEISGIVFLTVGTYILSLKKPKKIKTPFKEAINPKGHYYIIAALIIFTITAVLDKVVLSNFKVPVNAFMGFQHLYLALIFFLYTLVKFRFSFWGCLVVGLVVGFSAVAVLFGCLLFLAAALGWLRPAVLVLPGCAPRPLVCFLPGLVARFRRRFSFVVVGAVAFPVPFRLPFSGGVRVAAFGGALPAFVWF